MDRELIELINEQAKSKYAYIEPDPYAYSNEISSCNKYNTNQDIKRYAFLEGAKWMYDYVRNKIGIV